MSWIHLQSNILEYIILNYRSLTPSHEPASVEEIPRNSKWSTCLSQLQIDIFVAVQDNHQKNLQQIEILSSNFFRTFHSLRDRLMGLNSDPNTDNKVKSAILFHCVHTTLSYSHTTINHFNILQQYLISTFEKVKER